ncbi:MAG TPA: glycosyltransferase family A protein [Allosphingosinicella sp.]|jgi:glycosyltransferase involved in cell wall biosynthesis|nr:glycosyltransferase family A protein [Allosphingosinicella sp.]
MLEPAAGSGPDLPYVSIVTPTYGRSDTLLRAARSAADQIGVRVEHIVVGDRCPLLAGLEPALRAINPDIVILHLPPCSAPWCDYLSARIARARNVGIAAASGDYVCQLDSDNTLDPDHAVSLVAAIEGMPGAVGAVCGRKLLFSDGRPFDLPYHPWGATLEDAAEIWRRLRALGVYRDGSHLATERLAFDGVPFGVDADEIMLRRAAHQRYLFPADFTPDEVAEGVGEDDLLSFRLLEDGCAIAHSERHTLNFYLGGEFTARIEAEALGSLAGPPSQ